MALILLYHRVAEPETDPQQLCVSGRNFEEHLAVIQKHCKPLSMTALLQGMTSGAIPSNGIALTFDDGYADNLHTALPKLSRYGIPAAFYVTAGQIDRREEFWWDAVEDLLLSPRDLSPHFHTAVAEGEIAFDLGSSAYDDCGCFTGHRHWHIFDPAVHPRQAAYLKLCDFIRPLSAESQVTILRRLCAWAGCNLPARETHRALTADDLEQMATSGLADIGCHAMTHTILARCAGGCQREEIEGSRSLIEKIIKRPVTGFSYPFGSVHDYDALTLGILKANGFTHACANFTGRVRWDTDPFQLPRMIVRNWSGAHFNAKLQQWFGLDAQ